MPFNLKKLTERRVELMTQLENMVKNCETCLLYTSPSQRDGLQSRMQSSA